MRYLIEKLFSEAKSPLPDQAPAIECAVILRSGKEFQGSLSETMPDDACPEPMLRMLAPAPRTSGLVNMVEIYFSYDDVVAIAVVRQVSVETPRIVI